MCGILGVAGNLPLKSELEKARDVLVHRGPDDFGIHYDKKNGIGLGHRRLSIIDLSSAGHQPFFSNDKRYIIVFNGEIYNYLELRKELKDFYDFRSKTDTEVLLAAFIKWGEECLEKLNGMFAFAIWDNKKKELFCARDRLGIKPFYYHYKNNNFLFASEIKGLLPLGVLPKPNNNTIYDYLVYGYYDHGPETFFADIFELPAGYYLIFHRGKLEIKKYWDLADINNQSIEISEKKAKEKFLKLFEDSIKLRLRSDVPVGVNLSSGLDSSSILHFAEKVSGLNLNIFSMSSLEKDYDEGKLIKQSLSKKQLAHWHTSFLKTEEIVGLMKELLCVEDEPYGGIPTIAYYRLSQLIKEKKIKVILEGQAGDEILAGYKYYLPEFLKDSLKQKKYSQDMTTEINVSVLKKDFLKKHKKLPVFKKPFKEDLLNAQYRDIVHTKLPRVLRFNDRISMANSTEWREPFLDYRLVEFCFFLPNKLKISPFGEQKYLLRSAMRQIIPRAIGRRPKKTFGAIQTPWFRKYFKNYIMGILFSKSFGERPYWDQKKVLEEAEKFFNGEGDNSFFIWQWVNLELWLREYIDVYR